MIIEKLNGKTICVLGYGQEGKATVEALETYAPDANITIADQDESIQTDHTTQLGTDWLNNLDTFDVVIASPGIPPIKLTTQNTERITNATQIFLDTVQAKDATVVGVTGTKGKSTTASLIYEILKAAGKDVYLVGNIGIPSIGYIDRASANTIFVQEISSAQAMNLTSGPQIAVVTSFFPEHLDYHGSEAKYLAAKQKVCQSATHIFHANNRAKEITARASMSITEYAEENFETGLIGSHNQLNIAGAFKVTTDVFSVDPEVAKKAIKEFKGLPHRLELLGTHNGIEWIDDCISTTPESTIEAINALGSKLHTIILGGKDRGLDYTELGKVIESSAINHVILLGENSEKIETAITNTKICNVDSMKEAVSLAKEGIVLLSPAAASYDMFKNFEEKGDAFKDCITSRL